MSSWDRIRETRSYLIQLLNDLDIRTHIWEFGCPGLQNSTDGQVLIIQENHTHTGHGSWRCKGQIRGFENEIHIGTKGDTFTCRQGEEMIVIQDRVEGFDPFGVNITIIDNPGVDFLRLFDNGTSGVR